MVVKKIFTAVLCSVGFVGVSGLAAASAAAAQSPSQGYDCWVTPNNLVEDSVTIRENPRLDGQPIGSLFKGGSVRSQCHILPNGGLYVISSDTSNISTGSPSKTLYSWIHVLFDRNGHNKEGWVAEGYVDLKK